MVIGSSLAVAPPARSRLASQNAEAEPGVITQ
jgi:hypothetical protein